MDPNDCSRCRCPDGFGGILCEDPGPYDDSKFSHYRYHHQFSHCLNYSHNFHHLLLLFLKVFNYQHCCLTLPVPGICASGPEIDLADAADSVSFGADRYDTNTITTCSWHIKVRKHTLVKYCRFPHSVSHMCESCVSYLP